MREKLVKLLQHHGFRAGANDETIEVLVEPASLIVGEACRLLTLLKKVGIEPAPAGVADHPFILGTFDPVTHESGLTLYNMEDSMLKVEA